MALITKNWFLVLAVLCALFVLNESPYFHAQPFMHDASGETIRAQVEHDIRKSIHTLSTSRNLEQWKSSGFTPHDLLSSTLALKTKAARSAFCSELLKLSPQNLSPFEAVLKSAAARKNLLCTRKLLQRIATYWTEQIEQADARHLKSGVAPLPSIRRAVKPGTPEITSNLLNPGEYTLVFEGPLNDLVTREILKDLDERGVGAMFMVPGDSARDNPSLMELIRKIAGIPGSQSSRDRDMTLLPTDEATRSIDAGARAVDVATDVRSRLFAFPLNSSTKVLEQIVVTHGLIPAFVDLDSQDWKTFNSRELVQHVGDQIDHSSKGILLFQSDLRQTAIALPLILDQLAARRRRIVTFEVR